MPQQDRPQITGQLFFRGPKKGPDGAQVMMVVGVLKLPDDTEIKGEHQYTVVGAKQDGLVRLDLLLDTGADLTERTWQRRPEQILTDRIWRV